MYKRVILQDWHLILPYICFGLIAGAFCLIVIRACRIKSSEAKRLASLPLRDVEKPDQDDPAS